MFEVVVGPAKKCYRLHKTLLAQRSPYFAALLSFAGKEGAKNRVVLEEEVDTDDAFRMFVEFIYMDDYTPPSDKTDDIDLIHANVYVLAERFCMGDLKSLALGKAIAVLSDQATALTATNPKTTCNWGCKQSEHPPHGLRCTCNHYKSVDLSKVVEFARIIYRNTPDRHRSIEDIPKPIKALDSRLHSNHKITEKVSSDSASKTATQTAPGPKDKMRTLIARFCASAVEKMRALPEFYELVREQGEFSEDLMSEVRNGDPVKRDEITRL